MIPDWIEGAAAVGRRPVAFAVGGHRLTGEWLDPPAPRAGAAPLVFLHEGLGSVRQWTSKGLDVPAALVAATGRPALVYDRLGFGGADPLPARRTPRYLYDEAWQTLPVVLDQAGIGRAVLVGHSDGGSIALLFAARFPERSAAVVSEAAHVMVEPITLAGIRAARAAFHAPDGRLRGALARHHGTKTDDTFANWAEVWLSPEFAAFDMRAELPLVTAPCLVIQGEQDEYGSPAQVAAIAAGVGGPVEPWLVPDCGHVPHFQAAGRVLPRIAAFLDRLEASASGAAALPQPPAAPAD